MGKPCEPRRFVSQRDICKATPQHEAGEEGCNEEGSNPHSVSSGPVCRCSHYVRLLPSRSLRPPVCFSCMVKTQHFTVQTTFLKSLRNAADFALIKEEL